MNPSADADGARRSLRVVGGLVGALGPADVLCKLAQTLPATGGTARPELAVLPRPFVDGGEPGAASASQLARKLYVFDVVRQLEAEGAAAALVPCFLSHTFLDELRAEVGLPIVDMMAAIRTDILRSHAGARRIGVLTSDYVRARRLFETHFPTPQWQLVYPCKATQSGCVMAAIYGPRGIKTGQWVGESIDMLVRAGQELIDNGAELIVPGFAEIPVVIEALRAHGLPVLDSNQAYARAALEAGTQASRPVKIGVVGGVGPAATVDFMAKIVANTPADRDQDHLKLVVEQNPQIPDRTANLIGTGADPTVALYATCKRLEAAGADAIAIPCNTAHAFVTRIQPHLSVPILNMLDLTIRHLQATLPRGSTVGLLATSGTVASGIYAEAAEGSGLRLIAPDEAHQALVMSATYGPQGVKAGHVTGICVDELQAALAHLVERGAQGVILGCTELPLILASGSCRVAGTQVLVVDPTELLARRCVEVALTRP